MSDRAYDRTVVSAKMPVFSKGSRFHDASVPSHRAWTVQRRVGEGQSAEVYSVRCEQEPSTQVGRHTLRGLCTPYKISRLGYLQYAVKIEREPGIRTLKAELKVLSA